MKKLICLLITLLISINVCIAGNDICVGNNCFKEIYSYPSFGIYVYFGLNQPSLNIYENINAKKPYSTTKHQTIYIFDKMPNIRAFENVPKDIPYHLMLAIEKQKPVLYGGSTKGPTAKGMYLIKSVCLHNGSFYKEYKKDNFTNGWVNEKGEMCQRLGRSY